jgi:signal transduction histidine kinase
VKKGDLKPPAGELLQDSAARYRELYESAREELRRAKSGLEERVKERTAQLAESNRLLREEIAYRRGMEKELKESRERLRYLSAHLQTVREEERAFLSRELHDELGQVLTGMKMDVSWIGRRLSEDGGPIRERLTSLLTLIDNTILAVQSMSIALRPVALDDFGLNEVIELAAKEFEKRTKTVCKVVMDPPGMILGRGVCTEAFRIFQEALTNIARHAQAKKVSIRLQKKRDELIMEVRDDGKGITKKEMTDPRSIGITGMRERAYALGGTLTVTGIRDRGTAITLCVPLREDMRVGRPGMTPNRKEE